MISINTELIGYASDNSRDGFRLFHFQVLSLWMILSYFLAPLEREPLDARGTTAS